MEKLLPNDGAGGNSEISRISGPQITVCPLPGVASKTTEILDLVEPMMRAEHAALLDYLNEEFLRLGRACNRPSLVKIDSEGFNYDSRTGYKFSLQACSEAADFLRASDASLPDKLWAALDKVEALRALLSLALATFEPAPFWVSEAQSLRLFRYRCGLYAPIEPHVDPPIMTMVVVPPGDSHLHASSESGGTLQLGPFDESTAVIFGGRRAKVFSPVREPVSHWVSPLAEGEVRDVAVLFAGVLRENDSNTESPRSIAH